MKKLWLVFSMGVLLASGSAAAQPAGGIVGKWWNEEKDAQIEIYACEGKFCGRIVWLKDPHYPDNDPGGMAGKPRVDRENPDAARRERGILGMNLVWGFTPSGENVWEGGYIYNPREGKTYKCKLTLENPERLKVRGFIGVSLIGKTNIWTRVK